MAHKAFSAIQTILVQGKRACIYLQLTFGASANPAVWCGFSKMVCDLSNEMTLIGDLDPDNLFSPTQPKVPTPVHIDPLVLLAPARAMAVKVLTTSLGRDDCFLDDIIKVFLNRLSIIKKNAASVPLAMNVLMRLLAKDEPVPRRETLLLNKLKLEGTSSKQMIMLSWLIDTRRLLLRLPQDKVDGWCKELRELLADPKMSRISLDP